MRIVSYDELVIARPPVFCCICPGILNRTRDVGEVGSQRRDENMLEMEVGEETRKWLV